MKTVHLVVLLLSVTMCSFSQTTAQWLGTNRNGIYNEKQLLTSWPEAGPALVWSTEMLGNGYGSPAIASGKLFINGEIDSISHVFAFDSKGQLLWKTPNGKEFMGKGFSSRYPGARSTPTIAGDLLYACSGMGRVACFDTNSGKEKWSVDMVQQFKGVLPNFGYAESLLVEGDKVFCYPGSTQNNVVALNRLTGQTIWTAKALGDTMSYTSPMLIKLPTRNVLVNFSTFYIFGLDASTGELLWKQKQENIQYKQQCNTAQYENGFIYYMAGDGNGAVKLALSADGKEIKEVWRNPGVKNYQYGFVKLGDYLYGTDKGQKFKTLNASTGAMVDSFRISKGAIIAADGLVYLYSDNGEMNLMKPNGAKLDMVSKFKVDKGSQEHFAFPVIDKGFLYIRHGKALMAYDIKQK